MAFVNEYVPQKDIEKYGLYELRNRFMLEELGIEYPKDRRMIWTVDRDREMWLFYTYSPRAPEYDYRMPKGEDIYMLYICGEILEIVIKCSINESSTSFKDDPFIMTWDLISIKPEMTEKLTKEEIIQALKEALTIRGIDAYQGPHGVNSASTVENIIVKFNF